ncbi:MAG: AAA family ATPase [Deltaproteobacteria bacterium]|nr:AAA family ATPase [Desulfitobacteriaceae bacterium]MDI6854818.1 AAA family ATPase [Deltaproteobacteria bacterium]
MLTEVLNVAVLYGNGSANPQVPQILGEIPKVKLLYQAQEPGDLQSRSYGVPSDCVLVYLDGEQKLPEWLQDLSTNFPEAAVMLCSARMEPDFLIQAMQRGVREILPLPLAKSDLEAAFDRVRAVKRRVSDPAASKGNILVVTAHKGGAGTTTVAVNLAAALAEIHSQKILIMDLGRPFPDVGNFLDQEAPYNLFDLIQNVHDLDLPFLEKIIQPYEGNLSILHGISDFKEQDSIDLAALEKILALLRTQYAWIIIDLSHWLDELFLRVLGEADIVMLITALTVPDLRNLANLWTILRDLRLQQNKMKLVVNRYERGAGLSIKNLDQVVKEPVFATLSPDYDTCLEAINRGVPISKVGPSSRLCTEIKVLANKLSEQSEIQETSAGNGARPRRRFWLF